MTTTPNARARKQPQDRRPKASAPAAGDAPTGAVRGQMSNDGLRFEFTVDDGDTWHTSRELVEVFTPRWVRINRRRADLDVTYTAVEDAFAGDSDALDAWDSVTFTEQASLSEALFAALGDLTKGE